MSQSFNCHCEERKKPVWDRAWIVTQYMCHHSAFNGYHRTWSDYSTVSCLNCHAVGRTKANYVYSLKVVETLEGFYEAQEKFNKRKVKNER